MLSLGEIQRVLQALLREGVSIRDLGAIVEAIGDKARLTRDPALLAEYARQALGRTIIAPYLDAEQHAARDRARPDARAGGRRGDRRRPPTASSWRWTRSRAQALVDRAAEQVEQRARARAAARCCSARRACAATCGGSCEQALPQLAVCSYNEIAPGHRRRDDRSDRRMSAAVA